MIKRLKKIKKEEETPKEEPVVIEVKENMPQLVYGPPPAFPEKPADFYPEDNQVQEVYGPLPADEPIVPLREYEKVPEVIYGPPWVFGFDDDSGDGDDQC